MTKAARSPLIGQAQSISQQQQKGGQANINTGVGDIQQATQNPTQSPLYKALYNTEAGQMSKAYDSAASNTAQRARQAGFGYQQPAAQGAQDELRGREASSIGQLPGQVAAESVPLELQAGQDITQAGLTQEGQGNQMFTQGAVPLENQYQQYSQNYTPLWQRLAGGAIKGFLPGGQGALQGALSSV